MANFWSMVGRVFKTLFASNDLRDDMSSYADDGDGHETQLRFGLARFGAQQDANGVDTLALLFAQAMADSPETRPVFLDRAIAINTDTADPFQGIREAHAQALNLAHRSDARATFWGQMLGNGGARIYFSNDMVASSLYEIMMPLHYDFTLPNHRDVAAALQILLACEVLQHSAGQEKRSLHLSRFSNLLEPLHNRINAGDKLLQAGEGVAVAYAFGALCLAENGERGYCVSAIRALEPQIRDRLMRVAGSAGAGGSSGTDGEAPGRIDSLLKAIADFSAVGPVEAALAALYGSLLNWSLMGSMNARSAVTAVSVWKMLERRFDLTAGSAVSRAIAACRLGEALTAHARDAEEVEVAELGSTHFRRAIGLINTQAHAVLYAQSAYGLGESVVARATINGLGAPDMQVLAIFRAALKVCNRRQYPYLWGRIMFALGSVQSLAGTTDKDVKLLGEARASFVQAYNAFDEAGARGAARAASGSYTRTENLMNQLEKQQGITADGDTEKKAS